MPEVYVEVLWPDGVEQQWYSPSLVVEERLSAGATYPAGEFVDLTRAALAEGSARVEKLYGFPCSRAAASIAAIEQRAAQVAADAPVRVLGFRR